MKRLTFYLLSISVLILAACGNNEDVSTEEATATEEEDTSELNELEEENEELRRQLEEQDDDEGDEEVAAEEADDAGDESSDRESEEPEDTERSEEMDNQNDNTEGNKSDLVFDINSPKVQSQLIGTSNGNTGGNFQQDAITIGMSQTEVEEMYGPYDFSFYYQGAAPAFYGNLAVVYSELSPYGIGDGSDASMNDINPDENIVESVYYYAGITEGQMIEALGEPDDQDDGSRSMNGLPYYVYEGEGDDGGYYITGASTINTPDGERIGLIMRDVFDEDPTDGDQDSSASSEGAYFGDEAHTEGFPVTLTEEDDYYIYDTLRNFIFRTYLNSLSDYYNDEDDELLNLTEGNALQQVQENKASGYFQDYQSIGGEILSIEQISENEYSVTVNRTFSHVSSDGEQTAQVTYTVIDMDDMLKVSDFQ